MSKKATTKKPSKLHIWGVSVEVVPARAVYGVGHMNQHAVEMRIKHGGVETLKSFIVLDDELESRFDQMFDSAKEEIRYSLNEHLGRITK